MAISKKTWTGIARETTPGTAVMTPSKFIPTKTTFKGGKKREYLNEERGDRNANYGVVDSVRQSSVDMKGPYYNDVSPILFWAGMGLPTTTQPAISTDPTVYKHTFNLADVPPSYTINRSLDAVTYYVPYSVLEKWTLHFTTDGKLLELDGTWLGLWAQTNASPPTPTYSTLLPFAGYAPTIKFVDNVVSTDVTDLQIDYSQKITLWYPANGTQDFVTVYYGERDLKCEFTARFDNTTIYDRWRNNTNDSLTLDFQGPVISNTYHQELSINLPTISYDTVEHDTGKDNVMIKAKATALVPPGSSLITGFVQNTVASYTA
jgi:hypothetical protein